MKVYDIITEAKDAGIAKAAVRALIKTWTKEWTETGERVTRTAGQIRKVVGDELARDKEFLSQAADAWEKKLNKLRNAEPEPAPRTNTRDPNGRIEPRMGDEDPPMYAPRRTPPPPDEPPAPAKRTPPPDEDTAPSGNIGLGKKLLWFSNTIWLAQVFGEPYLRYRDQCTAAWNKYLIAKNSKNPASYTIENFIADRQTYMTYFISMVVGGGVGSLTFGPTGAGGPFNPLDLKNYANHPVATIGQFFTSSALGLWILAKFLGFGKFKALVPMINGLGTVGKNYMAYYINNHPTDISRLAAWRPWLDFAFERVGEPAVHIADADWEGVMHDIQNALAQAISYDQQKPPEATPKPQAGPSVQESRSFYINGGKQRR
jgi:hypothetical protein